MNEEAAKLKFLREQEEEEERVWMREKEREERDAAPKMLSTSLSRQNAPKMWLLVNSSIFISSLILVIYNKRHYDNDLRQMYLFYNLCTSFVWCFESLLDVDDAKSSNNHNNNPHLVKILYLVLLVSIFFLCQSIYMLIQFKTRHLSSDITFDGFTNTAVYAFLTFQSIAQLRRRPSSYTPIPNT